MVSYSSTTQRERCYRDRLVETANDITRAHGEPNSNPGDRDELSADTLPPRFQRETAEQRHCLLSPGFVSSVSFGSHHKTFCNPPRLSMTLPLDGEALTITH